MPRFEVGQVVRFEGSCWVVILAEMRSMDGGGSCPLYRLCPEDKVRRGLTCAPWEFRGAWENEVGPA